MPYKSPIEVVNDISQKIEDDCINAVLSVGIKVDKEELIKALKYDRGQYEAGFIDGAGSMNIVRCKDCRHSVGTFRIDNGKLGHVCIKIHGGAMYRAVEPDFFCAYGKPRCDNDDCIPDHVPDEDSWG